MRISNYISLVIICMFLTCCGQNEDEYEGTASGKRTIHQKTVPDSSALLSPEVQAILNEIRRGEDNHENQSPADVTTPRLTESQLNLVVNALGKKADLREVEFKFDGILRAKPGRVRNSILLPRNIEVDLMDEHSHHGSFLVDSGYKYNFEFSDDIHEPDTFSFWKEVMNTGAHGKDWRGVLLFESTDLWFARNISLSSKQKPAYGFVARVRHDGFVRFVNMFWTIEDDAPSLEDALVMLYCLRTWKLKK